METPAGIAFTLDKHKIDELLEMQLSICRAHNRNLAFAILKIDNFEDYNAKFGESAAQLTNALCNLLQSKHRASDFLAAYSCDSIAILFPETDARSALLSLERSRQAFANMKIKIANNNVKPTLSGGIASYPKHQEAAQLVAAAEHALKYSLQCGGNQITIWDRQEWV
jgi:diguanylate cyclase (GGDEF)-like protein